MQQKFLLVLVVWLTGCAACPTDDLGVPGATLLPHDFAEGAGLPLRPARQAADVDRARAIACPIVDVHMHTFNARYLPLQNILLGKRDKALLMTFLNDRWAKAIAAAVVRATHLSELEPRTDLGDLGQSASWNPQSASNTGFATESAQDVSSPDEAKDALERSTVRALDRVDDGLTAAFRALDKLPGLSAAQRSRKRIAAVDAALERQLSPSNRSDLRRALGRLVDYVDKGNTRQFIEALITPDGDLETRFHREYGDSIELCVSHTMDLAPVYAQREDGVTLLRFESDQLPRMDTFQRRSDSRMVYFVAYNPFRDNAGHGGDALRIVRTALEEHGAYGVKLYPPSGYRPSHNRVPPKVRTLFTSEPGKQWEFRYGGVGAEQLDARLDALFTFCLERDVPIFVHCNTGEFEARRGYGICMSDPRWWRDVLENYPKLRVCFGHAGGEDFWFGTHDEHEEWGRLVYELCVLYENVYCEFGALHQVSSDREREHFVSVLHNLFSTPRGHYPFEKKFMYGSDWYMPGTGEARATELRDWQATFLHPNLIEHFPAFFCGNALRFLDVERRATSDEKQLSGLPPLRPEVRNRLERVVELYQNCIDLQPQS